MNPPHPAKSLQAFEEQAFARHMLVDLPFPVVGSLCLIAFCGWLLHSKVALPELVLWSAASVTLVALRAWMEQRMRMQLERDAGHAVLLQQLASLSLPTGLISGMFAWLYFDAQDPLRLVVLATYMTVVIVGAVVPTSVYLPAFFLLVFPAHGPYMYLLYRQGGDAFLVSLGLNAMFLIVTGQYAVASNRMHRESVRLRFENQHLIVDLGERKLAAEGASQTKSLFLAGVSHDLKQPLRALALYVDALKHTAPALRLRALDESAPKIERALTDLHAQVGRLLELSRLESGALQLQMEEVRLQDVWRDLNALFEAQAQAKGLRLHFARLERRNRTVVWADRKLLDSVLQNLISNAFKYTSKGTVYVGIRWREAWRDGPCIEVRDSGRGISPEQQAQLFEAYRSFDDRKGHDSHGLGLALARAQAHYLGSDIVVQSAPACGSVFTLCGLTTR